MEDIKEFKEFITHIAEQKTNGCFKKAFEYLEENFIGSFHDDIGFACHMIVQEEGVPTYLLKYVDTEKYSQDLLKEDYKDFNLYYYKNV